VTAKFGIVDYSDLLIMGDVGYKYKFEFSCPNRKTKRIIKLPVDIEIAPCKMGEQLDPGRRCKQCKPGEYSPKGTVCLPCPTGGHCSKSVMKSDGSQITVGTSFPEAESGYWLHEAPRSLIDGHLEAGVNADFWNVAVADHTGNRHLSFYTAASKRQVRSQTVHCDWAQNLCSPGQYYDQNMGCKQLSGKTATQIFNCVSGMHFYRCPLEHHSCSYTKYSKESGAEKIGSHPSLLRHIALGAEKSNCNVGYMGYKCALCEPGYHKGSDNSCKKCMDLAEGAEGADSLSGRKDVQYLFYGMMAGMTILVMLFGLYLYLRQDDGAAVFIYMKHFFCPCIAGSAQRA
jgi:hypothetical protein